MSPDRFHYMRVEVTVAAAIVDPDEQIVGRNMVDATLVFGWRSDDATGKSDWQVNAALSHQLSPVLAILSTVMTEQGWVAMGQTDTPMKEGSVQVGQGHSDPVRVMLTDKAVRHD